MGHFLVSFKLQLQKLDFSVLLPTPTRELTSPKWIQITQYFFLIGETISVGFIEY